MMAGQPQGVEVAPVASRSILGLWPLLCGLGLLATGAGLQASLLSLRATLEGFPTAITGLVMSCYYLGFLAGTVISTGLVQSVGHVRAFAALAALASGAGLVQSIWVQPLPWAIMRLITGFCLAGIYVVAESWINERASSSNRGRVFAAYMVVLYVGMGCAQFLLTAASPRGQSLFVLVSIFTSLAVVPIVLSADQVPQTDVPRPVRYRDLYRNSPLGLVTVMVSGFVSATLFSMGPVYAHLSGFSTRGVAWFMAVTILAGMASQYPVGRLSDRMDRRTVIALMCALATVVAVSIVILEGVSPLLHLLLAALFAGFALTLYSQAASHVNDRLEPAEMVAASGRLLLANGAGATFGPFLAGSLMGVAGPRAFFAVLGTLTGLLTVYDLWRKARRGPPPTKRPFVARSLPEATHGGPPRP
jgi:MFS family permease